VPEFANEGSRDDGNGLGGDDAANDNQATTELDEGYDAGSFDMVAARQLLRRTSWEPEEILTLHSQLPGSPFLINLDLWSLALESNTFQNRTTRNLARCLELQQSR
jgi:hypothetical protein